MTIRDYRALRLQGIEIGRVYRSIREALAFIPSPVAREMSVDAALEFCIQTMDGMMPTLQSVAQATRDGVDFSPREKALTLIRATMPVGDALKKLARALRPYSPRSSWEIRSAARALDRSLTNLRKIR